MTPELQQGLYGHVSPAGYTQTASQATYRLPSLNGRPRYRLKNTEITFAVNVTIEADDTQFSYWQSFWRGIRGGLDPFIMTLMMDSALTYDQQNERYIVQALGPWSSALSPDGHWQIQLTVEVPSTIAYQITACDVIWALVEAEDDIWAGDITDLPEDVINPCPFIDPQQILEAA